MKSLKQFLPFTIVWILFLVFFSYATKNNVDINRVLESKEYSYLPVEARNYIEKIYEMSGELISTEKNKKENTPYLNPKYIEYLTLSSEEMENVSEIPEVYRIDYSSTSIDGDSLPSVYDLRNVNGKNFVTPLKNQGTLDLCWAFTTTEQAESLILKQKNESYSSSSDVFSPRQLDYATSNNGLVGYNNPFGVRPLTTGGNYFMASFIMANGLSLNEESDFPFDYSTSQKYYQDIFRYDNSKYELNSTISLPTLSNPTTETRNSFIQTVKNYVMTYGGAYVSSQAPTYSCSSVNSDGTTIIRVDSGCTPNANHAMQVIGWDDNYSYSYCIQNDSHKTNNGTCSGSNLVTGTGAWILRNSWGEDGTNSYVYLAYHSDGDDFRFATSLTPMDTRNWDNQYYHAFDHMYILMTTNDVQMVQKKINTPEKVQKVKFYSFGTNGTYKISVTSNQESYKNIKTVSVAQPGIVTVDLSDLNVVISDSSFNVEVVSTNNVMMVKGSISAFTKNVQMNSNIQTKDVTLVKSTNYYTTLFSNTKNIPSGNDLTYKLYNSSGQDYSGYLTVSHNKVGANGVNADLMINGGVPTGVYTLKISNGSYESSSKITLSESSSLNGEGTVSNPYLISSEADLKAMANSLNSHYKLTQDITLTGEWIPIGTEENPFTGSLDGNGYKIKNLTISEDYEHAGLFGYVVGNLYSNTTFQRIVFENPNIRSSGNCGVLVGTIIGEYSANESNYPTLTVTIQDITIMGGDVTSTYKNAGSLIGSITSPFSDRYGIHTYNIKRIFNSASVGGTISSGIIGYVYGSMESSYSPTITMENIQNLGWIDLTEVHSGNALYFNGSHASIIGYMLNYATISLNNYVVTSSFKHSSVSGNGLFGATSPQITIQLGNGYTLKDSNVTLSTMKAANSYSSWSSFNSNWVMTTSNGSTYIPILKGVNFSYTSIGTITIRPGQEILLSDSFSNKIDAMVHFQTGSVSQSGVIQVTKLTDSVTSEQYDLKIKGVAEGTVTIPVTNNYDGFEKTITVKVVNQKSDINFYKNDGSASNTSQLVDYQSSFQLKKNTFERVGYHFNGWNTQSDGGGDSYQDEETITANFEHLNLYAQWIANTYTIRYLPNGGEGTMDDFTATYGERFYLGTNTFQNEGYTFNGWNTQADGKGTGYVDKESLINLTSENGGVITLYAQWKKQIDGFEILEYSVDYDTLYIDDIKIGTSLEAYKSHFSLGDRYTITIDLGSYTNIYTGSKLKLFYDGNLVAEYTNIVRGDINGDGAVNSGDLFRLRQHLLNVSPATGATFIAADTNRDNTVNSGDLFRLRQHLLGVLLIS